MKLLKQIILVNQLKDKNRAKLQFFEIEGNSFIKELETTAFIGKNGMTSEKMEGDKKTPVGIFEFGTAFGTHKKILNNKIPYISINENLYWVDDEESACYNNLVNITKTKKDWNSAEHLCDYLDEYEYALEIKANPCNEKGKGSAIFLHCSNNRETSGCIAIDRCSMRKILEKVEPGAIIVIRKYDEYYINDYINDSI